MALPPVASSISSLESVKSALQPTESGKVADSGKDFESTLMKGLKGVNEDLLKANQNSETFLSGGAVDLHQVIISLEKADLSFRYMTQIRNKVLDAYSEIMRMQV